MKVAPGFVGFMFFAIAANAVLLFNDSFDYPDGPLVAVSTNGWAHHSGATGEVLVTSGRIQLNEANTEDVSALLSGRPYPPSGPTNVFYASFNVRFATPPANSGAYFVHFKDSGNGFRGRVWALKGGAPYGKFRLGISTVNGSSATATNLADLSLNTDYRVVTRLVNSNSAATLWIDPAAESDASVSTVEGSSILTVVAYACRENPGEGTLTVDDLKIGTTYADVANPAIAPPSIILGPGHRTVTNGADAIFTVTVASESPLEYQWRLNGTNLPGEIRSNLVLKHVDFNQAGFYSLLVTNGAGSTMSSAAALDVWRDATPAFSYLTYNVHGNGLTNWSTNLWHVQAIGRQLQYLDPDIIAFQEIPITNNCTAQMADFVSAFRPGFYLATNSMDDGYIHSAILSRYPIVASRSWLHGIELAPFGYTETNPAPYFTRDLFEAVIAVPDFRQPLHVFTVHLKSDPEPASAAKRAAEASAVSNFFATVYLPAERDDPYILSGDMNEDVLQPAAGNLQPIRRLANTSTGLQITTPVNPVTQSEQTWSIQDAEFGPTVRYDYIMPCAALSSYVVRSQVFRTDLMAPLPANLYSNDDKIASDHLPVLMVFANPFNNAFGLLSWGITNRIISMSWESQSNRFYNVEMSSNLVVWTLLLTNLPATGARTYFSTNVADETRFFRVYRLP